MGLIQVSLRPFRAEPFIGRFPGLKPRLHPVALRGIRASPKSAYLSDIRERSNNPVLKPI